MERNIALLLSYNGTAYHGWQVQKNAVSVAETLGKAIQKTVGHMGSLHGCGRTDAGVHARRYVANFRTDARIPLERIPYAINARLPFDISVSAAADVSQRFHAINSCVAKEYTYHIYRAAQPDPFLYQRALFCPYRLDADRMRRAATDFVGQHDFAAFRSVGTQVKTTVRTVFDCVVTQRGEQLTIAIKADGFLYNMARAIVGTLLYIGRGKLSPHRILELLASGARSDSGPTAPPHGLYMTGIWYEESLPWSAKEPDGGGEYECT